MFADCLSNDYKSFATEKVVDTENFLALFFSAFSVTSAANFFRFH